MTLTMKQTKAVLRNKCDGSREANAIERQAYRDVYAKLPPDEQTELDKLIRDTKESMENENKWFR